MKKRIGNDIEFTWHIYRKSGETQTPESFTGKEVEVKLISPLRQPVTIEDVTIATGVVTFTFRGKHQVTLGNYVAVLQENRGEDGMVTLDVVDAVTLVAHSYMEEDGDDGDVIEASSVELTSTISAGGGIEQQQADWTQTDTSAVDYIKNKPSIYDKNEIDDKLDKCAKLDNNNPYELGIWSSYMVANEAPYQPDDLYVDGSQIIMASGRTGNQVRLTAHGLVLNYGTDPVTISADSWRNKYNVDPKINISDGEVYVHDNIGTGTTITENNIQWTYANENTGAHNGNIWMNGNRLVMADDYHDNFNIGSPIVVEDDLDSYYTKTETDALLEDIEEVIPEQASASNQLADKNFVNSSIATATATYRGSYNLVSDLSLTVSATQQQIATALATKMAALSITPDNNDYCFVQVPTADATPTEIARIDRYKYDGTAWAYEYSLNNSSFTAAQWTALNSGITSGLVTKLSALPTNSELTTALEAKLDTITQSQFNEIFD